MTDYAKLADTALDCVIDSTSIYEGGRAVAAMLRDIRDGRLVVVPATALESAQRDSARLDWLAANPRITEVHTGGRVEDAYCYIVAGAKCLTLREIIDAAILSRSEI